MTASSAIEAIDIIVQFKPNLLISDLAMPLVNGYTLIRKIRTLDSPLGRIPAIAITAVDTEEGRNLALKYGFQACFVKPVDFDTLVTVIAEFIEKTTKSKTLV